MKKEGIVTPTETNVHGDALCFIVKTWARHKTTETVLNNGWRLAAVGGGWRALVFGGVLEVGEPASSGARSRGGCSGWGSPTDKPKDRHNVPII